jgi:glycosyltransferase involved in cell wall biosynthesis
MARRVATFVAPSVYVRDDWVTHGLSSDRVTVVPQAIDPKAYPPATPESRSSARKRLALPDAAFVVLYLGRIVPDKGVEVLVRAWRRMGLHPDDGHLLIVGPGWPRSYVHALHELAPPNCSFVDVQSDVVPILHAADTLVLPSLCDEAFGRVIIEAMATGCPAIASRTGGVPKVLTGVFSSMLVERGSEVELATRLGELRQWRHDDPALAQACIAHVAESFHLASAADSIERILEGVCA